jgi:hypothetical protein
VAWDLEGVKELFGGSAPHGYLLGTCAFNNKEKVGRIAYRKYIESIYKVYRKYIESI